AFYCLVLIPLCSFLERLQPRSTLFPYTTLFRSAEINAVGLRHRDHAVQHRRRRAAGAGLLAGQAEIADLDGVRRVGEVVDLRFRSEEHTSELQSRENLVCRLLLEKKKSNIINYI